MVLDSQRHRLDWWLTPLAKTFRHVDPDVFTWLSLLAAIVAGYAFYASGPDAAGLLLLGWGMVVANSVFDLLDGKIAKITGKQTQRGDFLDHAIDRFSDALIIGGIALSVWSDVRIGMAALVFTLLTSYLGTQAQAVGLGRNYGGLLGRADRMALIWIIPLIQYILLETRGIHSFVFAGHTATLLEWMLWYFAIIGGITTVQRFWMAYRSFEKDGSVPPQVP